MKHKYQEVNINSYDRISGTATNFNIDLPNGVIPKKIGLIRAVIPNSWDVINSTNNTIDLVEGALSATITIPIGSYTTDAFETALKAEIISAGFTNTYAVNGDESTHKLTISADGAFSILFESGSSTSTTCADIMGFEKIDYTGESTYTGTYVYNFSGANQLYMKLTNATNYDFGVISSNVLDTNILAFIPITENSGGTIFHNSGTAFANVSFFNCADFTNTMTFKLSFENDEDIDLNGQEWSCLIGVYY